MIIIGENINATLSGIKPVIQQRDSRKLIEIAEKQVNHGANYIDVNVGTGQGSRQDEIDHMKWAVQTLADAMPTPLCIDSADPEVIEAGLSVLNHSEKMINSTKAEEAHLNAVFPLAARYSAKVVALAMDESGIPPTVAARLDACRKIASFSKSHHVPMEHLYFDPLVLPVSTDSRQGMVTLKTLSAIKIEYPKAKTIMGLSNISYGLPGRKYINAAFLHMALYEGLDAVIINPLKETIMQGVLTGEAVTGKDRHFRRYSRALRKKRS